MDRLTKSLNKLLNKDVTKFINKYKIPLVGLLVVVLLTCVGFIVTYAFYQTVDTTPIIGGSTGKIADLEIRVMAEERDTNGNGLNSYALYPYIPQAGYAYNEAKSYCTNGSTINYNNETYSADITAFGHDVCYLYFDSTASLDLTLHVYAENVNDSGEGTGEYTKLETTALPSIGYQFNSSKSYCENNSDLSYSDAENMFSIEASEKDICYAYMDAMDVDIALKIFIQAKAGSKEYYEAKSIPNNAFYDVNTSKSACTGTSTLSVQNQKVVIAATGKTNCVAYLDVSSGPILESMNTTIDQTNRSVTITLANSNIGTTGKTYYYSKDNGKTFVSSTNTSYTFTGLDPATPYNFRAYSVDASNKTSAFLETTVEIPYVYNGAFSYASSVQTKTIEVEGYYKLQVWGAQGGSYNASYATGGKGGYAYGTVHLNKDDVLYIYTGGQGSYSTTSTYTAQAGAGVNGGGAAGYRGGGGGGGTDIRINQNSLYARVIVAGGGGGANAYSTTYKANGGAAGIDGSYYSSSYVAYVGKAGTISAGGAGGTANSSSYNGNAGTFGAGGNTGYKYNSTSYYSSGAGGGGWYGGGAAGNYSSSSRNYAAGGGGGSSYVYTEANAAYYPTGCLLTSDYYLTNAATSNGNVAFESTTGSSETGHEGNGYAKVTYVGKELS